MLKMNKKNAKAIVVVGNKINKSIDEWTRGAKELALKKSTEDFRKDMEGCQVINLNEINMRLLWLLEDLEIYEELLQEGGTAEDFEKAINTIEKYKNELEEIYKENRNKKLFYCKRINPRAEGCYIEIENFIKLIWE